MENQQSCPDVAGLGIGMLFIPSVVAVSSYFEKRQSIAIGVAVCGSGVGTFAIAPLASSLLTEYSWKGTFLIEAAILLNCIVGAMVFRPLNVPDKSPRRAAGTPRRSSVERAATVNSASSTDLIETCRATSSLDGDWHTGRRRFSESQLTARRDLFYSRNLDHTAQQHSENVGGRSSTQEQPEPQSHESRTATSGLRKEDEEKAAYVFGSGQSRIGSRSVSAPELRQISDAWLRGSERSEPGISSVVSRKSSTTPHDDAVIDRTAQSRVDRGDDDVRGVTSPKIQPEPRSANSCWPAKSDVARKGQEKPPTVVVGDEAPRMRQRSASGAELEAWTCSTSLSPDVAVQPARRVSESHRSRTTSTQPAGTTLRKQGLFGRGSVDHAPQKRLSSAVLVRYKSTRTSARLAVTTSQQPAEKRRRWPAKTGIVDNLRRRLSGTTIGRLFLDSAFMLFAVSHSLTGLAYVTAYVFLPDRGRRLGFDSGQSSWLISAVGMSNTVGRFVFGFVAGVERVNSVTLYSTMLVVCGVCSLFSVLLTTFPLQICYALCYGFLSSKSQYL